MHVCEPWLITFVHAEETLEAQDKQPLPDEVVVIPLFRRPIFPGILVPISVQDPTFVDWMRKRCTPGGHTFGHM